MLNHLSLGVRDLNQAAEFYDALFSPMEIVRADGTREDELAYAPPEAQADQASFWLYRVDTDDPVVGARSHVAFSVNRRAELDNVGAAAINMGANIIRPAGAHPDIGATYYGLILEDPSGHKLEFVAGES